MELIKEIKELISRDKLSEVIEILVNYLDNNEIYLQSAKYERLKSQIRAGDLNDETIDTRLNQIRRALLEIADEIEAKSPEINKKDRILKSIYYITTNLNPRNKKGFLITSLIGGLVFWKREKLKNILLGIGLIALGISFYYNVKSVNGSFYESIIPRNNFNPELCDEATKLTLDYFLLEEKIGRFRREGDSFFYIYGDEFFNIDSRESDILFRLFRDFRISRNKYLDAFLVEEGRTSFTEEKVIQLREEFEDMNNRLDSVYFYLDFRG